MLQLLCCNELSLDEGFYVAIEHFYVATEFGQDQGFYVEKGHFYVATEFGQGEEILCRDK